MDISIIIPFYDKVDWLYDAVNSINEEDPLSFEIIIVDDGSKEIINLDKIIRNKNKIKIFRQTNQGPGKARNYGISKAIGEYIAFLDSDDLFVNNKLNIQLKFMRNSNYIWSHSSYIKFYENDDKEIVDNSSYKGMIFPKCFAYNPIATPTVMVKKSALDNPPKIFSEKMRFGQDGFMWSQLAAHYSVGVIAEPLSQVRMRGTNATLKVKNHLYVKSKMYYYMKQSDKYYNGRKIPVILKIIFGFADFNYKIVELLFSRDMNKSYVESFSKLLYLIPYLALRVYKYKKIDL
ncbi:glycosyltransferase family 2 protein [Carnobacterium alterfunditum]|uniref:glycosyltransferase family 2 protein n=1 Tax=Carnobacterium alterfunditum TaxID=28230 RepID=UPI0035943694